MSNFICPVKGNVRLTSSFGWRIHPVTKKKNSWHQGIDLASTGKVPIYASADGEVIRVGTLGAYGNVVMIKHTVNNKRMDTNYAHLDSYCVKVGQKVKQGQQIGIMGTTGSSTGIHLHFEMHEGAWVTGQKNAVDPLKYISLNNKHTSSSTKQSNASPTLYRIKSGEYSTKSQAEIAKKQVAKCGFANEKYITIHEQNGKYYFLTGTYQSKNDAEQYLQKMKDKKILWVGHVIKA